LGSPRGTQAASGWLSRARAFPARVRADYGAPEGDLRNLIDLLLLWMLVYLLLGDGLAVRLPVGGVDRVLGWGHLVTIGLAVLLLVRLRGRGSLVARAAVRHLPAVLTLLALRVALPIGGVLFGDAPHLLAATVQPLSMAAWLLIGAVVAEEMAGRFVSAMTAVLTTAGVVSAAVGLAQAVFGYPGPGGILLPWIEHVQNIQKGELLSRATGLYMNPNAYALLGVGLVVWAVFAGRGRQRALLAGSGVLIVVLSSSRAASVALFVVVIVWLVRDRRRLAALSGRSRMIAAGLWVVFVAAVLVSPYGQLLFARLASAAAGLVPGRGLDPDVAARFAGWRRVAEFAWANPLGTLTPPIRVLGLIDSDYAYNLAQGGWLLLAAFVAALVEVARRARRSAAPAALRVMVLVVAVTGLSQYSSSYVPMAVMLWMLAGTILESRPKPPDHAGRADADLSGGKERSTSA
jgi:hypothetical protein